MLPTGSGVRACHRSSAQREDGYSYGRQYRLWICCQTGERTVCEVAGCSPKSGWRAGSQAGRCCTAERRVELAGLLPTSTESRPAPRTRCSCGDAHGSLVALTVLEGPSACMLCSVGRVNTEDWKGG